MTLEEALKRIDELEKENEALKAPPRPRKDPYPGFRESTLFEKYKVHDTNFSAVCSTMRKVTFGAVPCKRRPGGSKNIWETERAKTTLELTDTEYAHYSKFFHDLLSLITDYAEAWNNKEGL